MVTVVGITGESQRKLDKARKLEGIAKANFGEDISFFSKGSGNFSVGKDLDVSFYQHYLELEVRNNSYFDKAMKFAETYEREFGGEISIKTDYSQ